ncbi:restriction endonuclease [Gottfriedia sp. OAE603]|uniref:restriction endonuclease n=1 Tax=Gottfriedia sp. OAE603 TaxID=2663872 RepID=UPI00178ABB2B
MDKKQRKAIADLISLTLLIALGLFWYLNYASNYYMILAIIFSYPVINLVVLNILPSKKKKRDTLSKKKTSRKPTVPNKSNGLREDNVLITLPLEELSWREFEQLCYLYYKAKGYKPRLTSEGADGGVDLIIYNKAHKTEEAIQIKHYIESGNQITVKEIRELNSSKRNHGCILARFITTTTYTNPALTQADKFNIECHDIRWVRSKIVKWQNEEVVKKRLKNTR